MDWIFLFIAGIFEAAWAIGLKYTEGFTRLYPSVFTVVCMILSFYFLSMALKSLPIGTGYAVWTGIGLLAPLFSVHCSLTSPWTLLGFFALF